MKRSKKNNCCRTRKQKFCARVLAFGCIGVFAGAPAVVLADTATNIMDRLTSYSIDDLLNMDVTSVSKKPEQLSKSPAAISVLTQDDIQRSGARSIPEALRLVPGLDVAQVDSQQWAVSARGFNDVFADKLLVLQDGRSLYTPLFSGVFWDVQNPLLENIDRIEVIRGPGASLWGANAVNGVINIITKSAADTQGFFAEAGGGSYEQDFASARYGGKLADNVYYRVNGQYFDRGDTVLQNGTDAHDAWRMGQGGFRIDWDTRKDGGDLLTLEGDIYEGRKDEAYETFSFPPPAPPVFPSPSSTRVPSIERVAGDNVLGRWSHNIAESNDLTLQVYYDRTSRDANIFGEDLDTFDIDFQHHFGFADVHRNDIVWGVGYRATIDHVGNTPTVTLVDNNPTTQLYSAFVQDEITVIPDRLHATLGTKVEHNNYTKFEVQPDFRLACTPVEHQTIWGSISRAVRTPSEADEFIILNKTPPATPVPLTLYGNQQIRAEDEIAFQIGHRFEASTNLSFDTAAFYSIYNHVISEQIGASPTQPVVYPPPSLFFPGSPGMVPTYIINGLHGETHGVEVAATWEVLPGWRLRPSYSILEQHMEGNLPSAVATATGQSPEQQASLRSSLDLPCNVSLDATVRYVDRLPALGVSSYVACDARIAWRPAQHWELALVGQNLGAAHHAEFAPTFIGSQRTEIPMSVYAKVTCRF